MGLRDTLNNNSSVVTIVAVVVLVIALGIIVMTGKGRSASSYIVDVYFYDLNTGKLFVSKSDQLAPIETASGPTAGGRKAGVLAYVATCGECKNYDGMTAEEVEAAGARIVRLEQYTDEALQAMERARSGADEGPTMMEYDMMSATVVKRPQDTRWVPGESREGLAIMEDVPRCTSGERLNWCLPGR